MKSTADNTLAILHERCNELTEHVKLLRDYATTPDNVWLARGELAQIQQLSGEVEQLLAIIKSAG